MSLMLSSSKGLVCLWRHLVWAWRSVSSLKNLINKKNMLPILTDIYTNKPKKVYEPKHKKIDIDRFWSG